MNELRQELENIPAVQVSELFLSPHIAEKVILEATREPGPSMWIVNRSDVSSKTLEKLLRHPINSIAERAAEKIKSRKATITHLSTPEIEEDLSKVEDYGIEDILGHPLCPWEAMLFFAIHSSEDVRASACLSLTRRLWEHPAQSEDFSLIASQFKDVFSILASEDVSPMVRAYAARIPMWSSDEVEKFALSETHPHVLSKWLQHEECPASILSKVDLIDDFQRRVLALDARVSPELRKSLKSTTMDRLETLIHEAYLA